MLMLVFCLGLKANVLALALRVSGHSLGLRFEALALNVLPLM